MGSIIGLFFGLIAAVVGLALFILWIWMLIHAITNKGISDIEKVLWVIVIIFVPVIGPIIYFFVGRPKGGG